MELDDGSISYGNFPEQQGYTNPPMYINWPVKGVVVNVLHTDDPNNGQGQLLCDVSLIDYNYNLFRLPVFSPHFHQETDPSNTMGRQRADQRTRNIFDGESWTPRVGSICIVQFIGPPSAERDAVITAFGPVSNQALPHVNREADESIFPKEAQAVTTFDQSGELTEELRSRLQPTHSESPRYTRIQNGSAFEIDNRGNINLQSTINREPITREVYDDYKYDKARFDQTPDPEGNIVLSTRGARRGNIALATGRVSTSRSVMPIYDANGNVVRQITLVEPLDETNDEGNILLSTLQALQGNIDLASQGLVHLGNRDATNAAVLGEKLLSWIITSILRHTHLGVRSGPSMTGLPIILPPEILSDKVFVAAGSSDIPGMSMVDFTDIIKVPTPDVAHLFGDVTHLFKPDTLVKPVLNSGIIPLSSVASSIYDAGLNRTVLTIKDKVMTDAVFSIKVAVEEALA